MLWLQMAGFLPVVSCLWRQTSISALYRTVWIMWNPCCSLSCAPCSLRLGSPSVLATVTKTDAQQQVWPCLFGSLQTLQRIVRVCECVCACCVWQRKNKKLNVRVFFIVTYGTTVHVCVIQTSVIIFSGQWRSLKRLVRIMKGKV